jgi:molybdopterin biosynthesis enzyme MoaB
MFGGWDPEFAGTGGVILDTVHELDLTNGGTGTSWKKLDVTMPGGKTSRHVAVTIPGTQTILIHVSLRQFRTAL